MASVNAITSTGLTTQTLADRLSAMVAAFQSIYGANINLDPDSPDGQRISIFQQAVTDLQDLITQVNASFDPDQAVGVMLDARAAINGIQRQAGTHTITNITVVATQACSLPGLDQTAQPVYTISDASGTQWQLQTTQSIAASGTYVYAFQASNPGAVTTTINTITVPVTIVLGVQSVNNPTTFTSLGLNEESDAAFRIRRQQSVALPSQGYFDALYAALLNISGVTTAFIEENITGSTNGDGVTGHSIWVVVGGSPSAAAVAQAIYSKRNAGCGMVGAQTYNITQADGSVFTVQWDVVVQVNLFSTFTLTSLDGVNAPNISAILAELPTTLVPKLYGQVNLNEQATLIQDIDPNSMVTLTGFSAATTQTLTFSGTAASGTFVVNYNGNATASINWNDSASTIQTKLRAVSGLSACVVTGSISSKTVSVALTVTSALGLFYVTSNSVETSGSAAITITPSPTYVSSLFPAAKNYQFALASGQMVVLPIQLYTPNATVSVSTGIVIVDLTIAHGGSTATFTSLGGYAPYTYAVTGGAGSVDSSTGVYTSSSAGTDTLQVTDAFGNTATATITVT